MATAAAGGDRLGEILLREGLLTREQLAQALAEQKDTKHRLGYVLVKLGLVPELEITKVLARQYRMPAVDLSRFEVDPKILKLVPADMATKGVVLPLKREGRTLTVAMADPTDLGLLEDLKFITRFDLFPVIAGEYTLRNADREALRRRSDQRARRASSRTWRQPARTSRSSRSRRRRAATQAQIEDAPVVKLINGILIDAVKRGASDIHIEPYEKELRVRYRIDGVLLRDHAAAAQDEGGAHLAHQDHGEARHRRAAAAAGRPHQAQDGQPGDRLPRLDACRRCSARRSSCDSSTRAT